MNIDNIKLIIKVLRRAKLREKRLKKRLFDMATFQTIYFRSKLPKGHPYCTNDKQFLECNTNACMSGLIAVAPEFQKQGIIPFIKSGAAIYKDREKEANRSYATGLQNEATITFKRLLDIDLITAHDLIFGYYHQVLKKDITLDIVIDRLKDMIKTNNIMEKHSNDYGQPRTSSI